jgi:hypothetical protein
MVRWSYLPHFPTERHFFADYPRRDHECDARMPGTPMPNDTTTRWIVSVSKDIDISVRSFLARRGMNKGDLSKFIEDAVK